MLDVHPLHAAAHSWKDFREQLTLELAENTDVLRRKLDQVQKDEAELDRDMQLLRQWQAAKENGSLNLMPYQELKANAFLYTVFGNVMEAATAFSSAVEVAGALAKSHAGSDLSPHDTEEFIAARRPRHAANWPSPASCCR